MIIKAALGSDQIILRTNATSSVYSDLNIGGNLSVSGSVFSGGDTCLTELSAINLNFSKKPHVAFRLNSNVILSGNNNGIVPTSSISLQAGRVAGSIYRFTFSPAHPRGTNYVVMATPNTGATSTQFYICTSKVESSTSFPVWCRTASKTIIDADVFVATIP